MGALLLPQRRSIQPSAPLGIDWSNPLTRGLVNAINFATGHDAVRNRLWSAFDGSRTPTAAGLAFTTSGGTSADYATDATIGSGQLAVHVLFRPRSWAAYQTLFTKGYYEIAVLFDGSGNVNYCGLGSSAGGSSVATGLTAGLIHTVTAVVETAGAGPLIYANGVYIGDGGRSGSTSATDGTIKFGEPASGGGGMDGDYIAALVYNRKLFPREVDALNRNPWQVFAPFRRRLFAAAAGGGSNYSVDFAETASATDAYSNTATLPATLTEAASAADTLSSLATLLAAVAESAAATDAVSNTAVLPAAVSEAGSATDTVTTGAASYSVEIAEAASAADAIAAVLTAGATLAESATASDVVSSLAVLLASLAEAGTASDIYSTSGAIYSVDFAEAASAVDAIAAQLEAAGALTETGAATDGVSALVQFGAAVAEAVAALDAVAATGIFGVTITEAGNATDLVSAPTGFGETPPSRTIVIQLANRTITVTATNRTIRVH